MVRRIGIVDGFDVAKTGPQGHQKGIQVIAFGQWIRLRIQSAKPVVREFGDQRVCGIPSQRFCYKAKGNCWVR